MFKLPDGRMCPFTDMEDQPLEMQIAVMNLYEDGLLKGTSPTTISPDRPITRGESAIIADRQEYWQQRLFDKYNDAVVTLFNTNLNNLGTGWFIDQRTILTARHVVYGARAGQTEASTYAWTQYVRAPWGFIRVDNNDPEPGIVYADPLKEPNADLAAIILPPEICARMTQTRIAAGLPAEIPTIPFRYRRPIKGDELIVFGSPLGNMDRFTNGRVGTFLERSGEEWFDLNAGINPGHSGGPVLSKAGRLLGMTLLKQWYGTAFGYTASDDMGLIYPPVYLVAWLKKHGLLPATFELTL